MKHIFLTIALTALSAVQMKAVEIIHGPYLQNLGSDRVTIVWVTDSLTVGWVELAPDDKSCFYDDPRDRFYDAPTGVKETSRIHSVTIDKLAPNTTYRYRVYAREVTEHRGNYVTYGRITATSPHKTPTFKTMNPNAGSVRFASVNDIHGDNEKLASLVGKCDLSATDFFVFNGDMVSVSETEEQVFSGFMDTAVTLFATSLPMYYCRGNHETRGAMATRYNQYFSPGLSHIYYTFRQGPVFCIVLDGGEDKPDTDIEYYDITDYDHYRTVQAEWLEEVLQSEEYRNAPFKVVFCHMPPEKHWHGSYEVLTKFVPVLNTCPPDLFVSGHYHRYDYREANTQIKFPVLINDNKTVAQFEANDSEIKIKVIDTEGKTIDTRAITK